MNTIHSYAGPGIQVSDTKVSSSHLLIFWGSILRGSVAPVSDFLCVLCVFVVIGFPTSDLRSMISGSESVP